MANPQSDFIEAIADAVVRKLKADGIVAGQNYPKLLEIREAAEYLKRSDSSVRELIRKGQIPARVVKKFGGRTVLIRSELDKWLDAPHPHS